MVWSMISRDGERRLVMVEGTINADTYINILDENLLDFDGLDDIISM